MIQQVRFACGLVALVLGIANLATDTTPPAQVGIVLGMYVLTDWFTRRYPPPMTKG